MLRAFLSAFLAFALTCGAQAATATVFITSGTTFTVPADYASLVSVECIGAGGNGITAAAGVRGTGGGGGEYRKTTTATLAAGNVVNVAVASGGSAADTTFADNTSTVVLRCKPGANANGTTTNPAGGSACGSLGLLGVGC